MQINGSFYVKYLVVGAALGDVAYPNGVASCVSMAELEIIVKSVVRRIQSIYPKKNESITCILHYLFVNFC